MDVMSQPRRVLRLPSCTPLVTHRLRQRRDPAHPSVVDTVLYLPWRQMWVMTHTRTPAGWLCTCTAEADRANPCGLVVLDDAEIATALADAPTGPDLVAAWLTTVESRCGIVRVRVATALGEYVDDTGEVAVGVDAYHDHLLRRCGVAVRSYAGFRVVLGHLVRGGVLHATTDLDRVAITPLAGW